MSKEVILDEHTRLISDDSNVSIGKCRNNNANLLLFDNYSDPESAEKSVTLKITRSDDLGLFDEKGKPKPVADDDIFLHINLRTAIKFKNALNEYIEHINTHSIHLNNLILEQLCERLDVDPDWNRI